MAILQRASLLAEAYSLTNKKPFDKEDSAKVDALLRLADSVAPPAISDNELRRARLAEFERETSGIPRPSVTVDKSSEYDRRFYDWLHSGDKSIRAEMREYTPQTTAIDNTGGELIPQGFQVALLDVMKAADGLFSAATLVPTTRGNSFSHPIIDDADSEAEVVDENTVAQDGRISFGAVEWPKCPRWSSGWSLVPVELAADSAYDLPSTLAGIFGTRFARGIGRAFVTTLLNTAESALTSASATAVEGDELLELMASPNPAYGKNGSFLMNFRSYLKILQLRADIGGAYQFAASVDADGTPLLCGRRVLICPNMPDITSGQKAIAYGDASKFLRREVIGSLRLRVANERFIESGQFGYQSEWRVDGALPLSGNPSDANSPVKYITQKA